MADIEAAVDERLAGLGVAYDVVDCDPALAATAAFCDAYGYAMEDSANTIVVIGKSEPPRFVACVVLATTRLDVNGVVRRKLGTRKASFSDAARTEEITGMTIGGVTPFGLPDDMPLWIDAAVVARDRLVFGGGSRRRKIVGPPGLLLGLVNAEVVDGLARPVS